MNYRPFEIFENKSATPWVIICDHASNIVPESVAKGSLGLDKLEMKRHIAFDIGAKNLAVELGNILKAPVICSNFSRLVIDPNRGEKDPTLVMQLYDGTIIPANKNVEKTEILRRLNLFYRPYHDAIEQVLARLENPIVVSIHSFTPQLKGKKKRPWQIGLLAANDRRLHDVFLRCLKQEQSLYIGDNQPYVGKLPGDTIDQHAIKKGRLNTLIEVRNDLICNNEKQKKWAAIIGKKLNQAKDLLDGRSFKNKT